MRDAPQYLPHMPSLTRRMSCVGIVEAAEPQDVNERESPRQRLNRLAWRPCLAGEGERGTWVNLIR
jgi:hypothetical protein